MQSEIESLKKQWSALTELSWQILEESDYKSGIKDGWAYTTNYELERINDGGQNERTLSSYIQFCIKGHFKYWEMYIDVWTELFWEKAKELETLYERKEPLRKVLERGRFSSIGEAMHTSYQWDLLLKSGKLQNRYTQQELESVEGIIYADKVKRLELLKKCLRLNRVSLSDYLKYGEAIAYFTNGNLLENTKGTMLEKLFKREEIERLSAIWY